MKTELQEYWCEQNELQKKKKEYTEKQRKIIQKEIEVKVAVEVGKYMHKNSIQNIGVSSGFDRFMPIDSEHISVFACKNDQYSQLFIYVFSNRKKNNSQQSRIEVEVWVWDDRFQTLEVHALRQYLSEYITDRNGKKDFLDDIDTFHPLKICNPESDYYPNLEF